MLTQLNRQSREDEDEDGEDGGKPLSGGMTGGDVGGGLVSTVVVSGELPMVETGVTDVVFCPGFVV